MAKATTKMIVDELQKVVTKFFETYTPQYITTLNTADAALKNISTINDSFWPQVVKYTDTNLDKDYPDQNDYQTFVDAMVGLMSAMENALLETFKINLAKEVDDENKSKGIQQTDSGFESELNDKMWIRFQLIVSPSSRNTLVYTSISNYGPVQLYLHCRWYLPNPHGLSSRHLTNKTMEQMGHHPSRHLHSPRPRHKSRRIDKIQCNKIRRISTEFLDATYNYHCLARCACTDSHSQPATFVLQG